MVLKESNLERFYKFGCIALFLRENNSNSIYFFIKITNNFNIYIYNINEKYLQK